MSLTREDFTDIKNELDDRYVLQSDCNDKQDDDEERKIYHQFIAKLNI